MKSALRLVYICGLLIPLILAKPALAGLGVSGSLYMDNVNPGQAIVHEITVETDPNDSPLDILVDVVGFGQTLDGSNSELKPEDDTSPYSARSFLKVTPTSFHLDPGNSQKVTLEGTIPQNIGDGGRYALVSIRSLPIGNGTVGISVGIDALVLLTIAETKMLKTGEIMGMELIGPISAKGQNVSLTFENTGNYHYKARAEAVLRDDKGEIIANSSTPLSFSSILPTMLRKFDISLRPKDKLSQGKYQMDALVSLEDGTVLANDTIDFKV